jgi:hypothetical protein
MFRFLDIYADIVLLVIPWIYRYEHSAANIFASNSRSSHTIGRLVNLIRV